MVEVDPAVVSAQQEQSPDEVAATQEEQEELPDGTLSNHFTIYAQNKSDGWDSSKIKALANFNTIDQFWGLYQHMKRPNEMPEGTTINLFQKGIKPEWEDPQHQQGASLRLQFSKGYANQIWEDLILAFIGEQFELENEITGIVLSVGRIDKLSIWYRHGFDNRVAPQIKSDLIKFLGLPQDIKTSVSVFFPANAPGGGRKQHNDQRENNNQSNRRRELTSYSQSFKSDKPQETTAASINDMLE